MNKTQQKTQIKDTIDIFDPQKSKKDEKKCRRAIKKAGMRNMSGVSRITIQKKDGLSYVIDDPELLNVDSSFAFFGDL